MTKLITLPVLYSFWASPVVALLLMVALVFLIDLLNRYWRSKEITCMPTDFSDWSYREVQILCKAHGIKSNQKRAVLLEGLNSI